jgi:PAS domain S-box-containing protein
MNVIEAIHRHRETRIYAPRDIDAGVLRSLVAVLQAPTPAGRQPRPFAVVRDPALLERYSLRAKAIFLAEMGAAPHAESYRDRVQSPSFDVFCGAGTLIVIGAPEQDPHADADCWLAAQRLTFAASDLGLVSCTVGLAIPLFNEPEAKAELGLPVGSRVVVAMVLGYPAHEPPPVPKRTSGIVGATPPRGSPWVELEMHKREVQNETLRAAWEDVEAGLRRYTELFDFAPIGYALLDAEGAFSKVNWEGARLLGHSPAALSGQQLLGFVDVRDRRKVVDLIERVLTSHDESRSSASCEVVFVTDPGYRRDVRLSASVLAGSPRNTLVCIEDVTTRKRAETALHDESRRKDEFLAALSHELRNPLAPIRSSLQLLGRVEPGGEAARKALAIVERQVDHLARIVGDLLDVTRIAHGKIRLETVRLDLGELVRHTIDDYRREFQASGIVLEGRFDDEKIGVDADPTRLTQVLGNLLGNALKFTPPGGRVDVSARRDGAQAVVSIRDTGIGITEDVRDHLFRPFAQAPQSTDRADGGLGLGLAMVKGLVELHGGSVEVHSAGHERGAEFLVRLPLGEAPPVLAAPPSAPREGARRRVLVIEDGDDARESMRDLLELSGHDVKVACDGPEGIDLAKAFRPEVVFCDLGLPGVTGYDVARTIRADGALQKVRLIALSGYAQADDRRRSLEAGFDRHLAKPTSDDDLQRALAETDASPL